MCVHVKLRLVVYLSERLECIKHVGLACCLDGTYFNFKTRLTCHIFKLKGYVCESNVHVYISLLCITASDWIVPSIYVTSLLLRWHIFQQ